MTVSEKDKWTSVFPTEPGFYLVYKAGDKLLLTVGEIKVYVEDGRSFLELTTVEGGYLCCTLNILEKYHKGFLWCKLEVPKLPVY
jgi:hypothetical protein